MTDFNDSEYKDSDMEHLKQIAHTIFIDEKQQHTARVWLKAVEVWLSRQGFLIAPKREVELPELNEKEKQIVKEDE